jgi:hypothetical protein
VDGAFEVPDEHAAELAAAFGMSKAPPGPTEIDQLRARIAELESVIETGKATNERQAARIAELEAQPAEGKKKRGG